MADERLQGISKRVEGPARIVGAAAIAVSGAFAVERSFNAMDDTGNRQVYAAESIDKNRLHLESSQALNFRTVCVDPEGDEHPRKVDILKVEMAEGSRTHFRFTLAGDVTSNRSEIGPDVALGGGFVDSDGKTRVIFHAKGAERDGDLAIHVERLSTPVVLRQGRAIPFRIEESLSHEPGDDFIEVDSSGRVVTFSIPSRFTDQYGENITYITTEAQGHGNRRTQTFNKDACESQEVSGQPGPTNTPRPGERPNTTPQLPLTPGAPEVLPPAPVAGLPKTGEGGPEEKDRIDADDKAILGLGVIGIGLMAAGSYLARRNRRRN